MARRRKNRTVQIPPCFKGFSPVGCSRKESAVTLTLEEYEAINLCDYERLTQAQAGEMMGVSRPTMTRIYESARQKIAQAFIEGRSIVFTEGDHDIPCWYKCGECGTVYSIRCDLQKKCPLCKNENSTEYDYSHSCRGK